MSPQSTKSSTTTTSSTNASYNARLAHLDIVVPLWKIVRASGLKQPPKNNIKRQDQSSIHLSVAAPSTFATKRLPTTLLCLHYSTTSTSAPAFASLLLLLLLVCVRLSPLLCVYSPSIAVSTTPSVFVSPLSTATTVSHFAIRYQRPKVKRLR